ncbi:hypothetical protein TKV_c12070 [Thermoanaerobacter kivui]|uniref:Small integral membrane protein n=1 Tax=Thermoanaerobacter kivui TaxID=2325 RepID=A0A097ARE3_THEKI|nr:DUF2273 domain-containing protein [Thermoanaerobacter kivui]AIS52378.1 hypothetical protein TKV_c12070 [Thermoanaerobacter kivui]
MDIDKFFEVFKENKGKIIGVILGFIVALSILLIGFFKTIFIGICIIGGYYIGKKIDEGENIANLVDSILPPWKRRS